MKLVFFSAALFSLGACTSSPAPAQWQMDSTDSLRRAQTYFLEGRASTNPSPAAPTLHDSEMRRVRQSIAQSGDLATLARAETAFCAAQAAALDSAGLNCPALAALQGDADAATQAYARYLGGKATAADVALLPEQHRAAAQAILSAKLLSATPPSATVLANITDPIARLVAASAALQAAVADDAVITTAVNTASAQGFRRALLAWLGVQRLRASAAGDMAATAASDRRIALASR